METQMSITFNTAYAAYKHIPGNTPEDEKGFLELLRLATDWNDLHRIFESLTSNCLTIHRPRLMMLLARADMMALQNPR